MLGGGDALVGRLALGQADLVGERGERVLVGGEQLLGGQAEHPRHAPGEQLRGVGLDAGSCLARLDHRVNLDAGSCLARLDHRVHLDAGSCLARLDHRVGSR